MAEAQAPETPSAPAPAAPEPQGLEKVYQDFGIEDQAAQFQQPQAPQPAQQATPQPSIPKVPDPFDPNFASYQAQLANGVSSLQQAFQQMAGKVTAFERQQAQRQVEADIKQAVGVIVEKAGIDAEIAEVALEAKARQDPKFLQIWNNRSKNPKAYQAALQAVSGEFGEKYKVRQDPQLAENQRAVKASQQQMATTQKQDPNEEWASMTPAERQAKVRRMVVGGF